jgi:hypothetical protein
LFSYVCKAYPDHQMWLKNTVFAISLESYKDDNKRLG